MRTALLIARGVAAATLAAILVVFVALSVVTQIAHRTGFPLFVIDGSSMSPSIARGGLAFEQPVDPASIRVGDVVTVRQSDQAAYTHRVVAVVDSPDGPADPDAGRRERDAGSGARSRDGRRRARPLLGAVRGLPAGAAGSADGHDQCRADDRIARGRGVGAGRPDRRLVRSRTPTRHRRRRRAATGSGSRTLQPGSGR